MAAEKQILDANIWLLRSEKNLIWNVFQLLLLQHEKYSNNGIKSFYPVE